MYALVTFAQFASLLNMPAFAAICCAFASAVIGDAKGADGEGDFVRGVRVRLGLHLPSIFTSLKAWPPGELWFVFGLKQTLGAPRGRR